MDGVRHTLPLHTYMHAQHRTNDVVKPATSCEDLKHRVQSDEIWFIHMFRLE